MKALSAHLRSNVVGYLALFVALGGTSYAAANLSSNSVGARQIRRHSITPSKFNPKLIAGSIRAWVNVQWRGGRLVANGSSSRVRIVTVSDGEGITWHVPHRPTIAPETVRNCSTRSPVCRPGGDNAETRWSRRDNANLHICLG